MNYLTTGLLTGAAIGAPIAGFSLTTPAVLPLRRLRSRTILAIGFSAPCRRRG